MNKLRSKKIGIVLTTLVVLLVVGLFRSQAVLAVPADPTPWTFEQPDGSMITLQNFGDQFFSWTETSEGYIVVYDEESDSFYYASASEDGLYPGTQMVSEQSLARGQ